MKSLRIKISLCIIAICLVQAVVLGVYSVNRLTDTVKASTKDELVALASQAAVTVEKAMDSQYRYLEALATNELVCSPKADDLKRKQYLYELAKQMENVNDIGFADLEGNTLTSDMETVANISKRPYFQKAVGGECAASNPIEDLAKPGVMVMQFAIPVYYEKQIVGVLYMLCDGNFLSNITNPELFMAVKLLPENSFSVFSNHR